MAGARRSPSVLSSSLPSHLAYCFWYMCESSDWTWGVIILLCCFFRPTLNVNVPQPCRYLGLEVGFFFFLISTFFVLIEKKNLNILWSSHIAPLSSLGRVSCFISRWASRKHQGILSISGENNHPFLKRDDNTLCIWKLKTQTLSGRSGTSASWTGTVF